MPGGFNVFVCFVCELSCAVVWCILCGVLACVRFMCLRGLRVMYCVML